MNPLYSVRFRLFALCVGLLLVLGGANVLLGHINHRHEAEVALLQEQYRRVGVTYAVQEALAQYRHWVGRVDAAVLVENKTAQAHADAKLKEAGHNLEFRLNELAQFDSVAVTVIRQSIDQMLPRLRQGVAGLVKRDPGAEEHINQAVYLMNKVDETLHGVAAREKQLALDVQYEAQDRAATGQRVSIGIIVASTAFGLLLTFVVLNSIIGPMQTTVKALRLVNAGETAIDLPPVSQDEFGDMAVALRQFRDQAERLRRLAYRDSLTGIGNRAHLEDELRRALEKTQHTNTRGGLFFIDLDNFRAVNDSLGHSAGDSYLCEAVVRLQRFIPDSALVCRYGGDKFAVLASQITAPERDAAHAELRRIATNVLRGMGEPFQLGGDLLPMSVSVGIAVFPDDGTTGEQVVSSAEAAMYLAKRSGRNNAQFASPELTGDARRQLAIVSDIRRGLDSGEFEPFYQPVVDVVAGRVVAAEALIRWRHPQRGLVMASDFVPAAEASGLIHVIGERCMEKACEQATKWFYDGGHPIRVAVNLSARQIEDRTALPFLERLHATSKGAKGLDFEITETAMLQHLEQAQETLKQIRALGHQLGVDDFGTGYSSLVYLQRFPLSRIKIDRSFVSRVETSREAQAIVAATIALGRSLDLEVVAEGVETEGQLRQLQELGCTLQQGFYFTPALPAAEFELWTQTQAQRFAVAA